MMIPLESLLKSKIQLYKNYNLQDETIDNWPFWLFEENVKLINDMNEKENKERKKQQEQQQSSMGKYNPSSYMKNMSGIANKFKK